MGLESNSNKIGLPKKKGQCTFWSKPSWSCINKYSLVSQPCGNNFGPSINNVGNWERGEVKNWSKLPMDSTKNLPTWGREVSKIQKNSWRCLWMIPLSHRIQTWVSRPERLSLGICGRLSLHYNLKMFPLNKHYHYIFRRLPQIFHAINDFIFSGSSKGLRI